MGLDLSSLDDDVVTRRPATGGGASHAPLSWFEKDPGNPRFEDDPAEFALFVADVRERGILQPIIVRRLDDGKLRIRFGARRFRAALELGLPDAPYVVTEDARQFDDYAQVAENERRAKLQPLELATFIAKKLAEGANKRVVASRLRIDPSSVTHLLALTGNVPAFLLELYHSRRCRSPKYLYRLRVLWETDAQAIERSCALGREIDGTFIDELSRQDHPKAEGQPPVDPGGGATILGRSAASSVRTTLAPGAPTVQMEAADSEPATSGNAVHLRGANDRSWTPELYGRFKGRDVVLHISLRPTTDGQVFVRFLDSDAARIEIPLAEIVLTRLIPKCG